LLNPNAGNDEFTLPKSGKSSHYGLYMLPLVVGPFCLILMAFIVLPTEWFSRHSGDAWLSSIGYGGRLVGQTCQILIYGDSSAEVGVDPAYITEKAGLQACNIAEPVSFRAVNRDVILDTYLAKNNPPRVIVILLAPEAFSNLPVRMFPRAFEGITWRMRQPNKLGGIVQSMEVPENIFRWVYKGDHLLIRNLLKPPISLKDAHIREATHGQLLIDLPRMSSCSDSRRNFSPSRDYITKLRSRYQGPNTSVLLDVMPLPQCDLGFSVVQKQLHGLVDNKVEQFPNSVFYEGGRHVDKSGSVLVSQMIADQVQQKLNAERSSGKH
jgi:hypothetical protein